MSEDFQTNYKIWELLKMPTVLIDNSKEATWKINKLKDKPKHLKDQEAISEEVLSTTDQTKELRADLHSAQSLQSETTLERPAATK